MILLTFLPNNQPLHGCEFTEDNEMLVVFLFIILNIIKEMTISSDQASEAIIFLTVYNEAISNLEYAV